MSKEEIIKAIRMFAKKHGHNPTIRDVALKARVTRHFVYHLFGSWRKALVAAGLQASGPGFGLTDSALLLDWAATARKLGKIPSAEEYEQTGRFSSVPFYTRYRRWRAVPEAFAKCARKAATEKEWQDVLEMMEAKERKESKAAQEGRGRRSQKDIVMRDRPIYGSPLWLPELAHEPVNEAGVIFVFGMVARKLGFSVLRLQAEFPDCEAMREVAPGQWQRIRIEFEFESKNFLKHGHKASGCDVIVCWRNNWPECPLEVIELSKVVKGL